MLGPSVGASQRVIPEHKFLNVFEGFSHTVNEAFHQRCVFSLVFLDVTSLAGYLCRLPL